MPSSVDLEIRPVTPNQHDAVIRYFDLVAHADNPAWSSCYCIERVAPDFPTRTKEQNRASRSELMRSAKANGLVAYRLGRVVGWCHAAPTGELLICRPMRRATLARLSASSSRLTRGAWGSRRPCWRPRSITFASAGCARSRRIPQR